MEVAFGKERRADLSLDPDFRCINAGSFGVVPNQVLAAKNKFQQRMNSNPQKWFRIQLQGEINRVRTLIAKKVNCNPKNLFLVQNATEAFNALMKSLDWNKDDTVILPNVAYQSIRNTVLYLQQKFHFTILNVQFNSEDFSSNFNLMKKIKSTVENYSKKITLAVFDHIISKPALVCPVQQITQYFKQKKIPIFIDGAHALGQLNINLQALNPQCYFSNAHKWAFSPKSAAFLYIADDFLEKIKPVVTSNHYGQSIDRQFLWTGTKDISSFISVQAGFKYSEKLGQENIRKHNHQLAVEAGRRVAQIWGTRVLSSEQKMIGFMTNVQLPTNYDADKYLKLPIYMTLFENTFPLIFRFDGKLYLRISCQIYNELDDYQWAAKKIVQLIESPDYEEWYHKNIVEPKQKKFLF